MRFYWKVFLVIISLTSMAFCVSGTVILSKAFNSSLEQEIERGKNENRILQFAFQTAINSVPSEYFKKENNITYDVANSLKNNMTSSKSHIRILSEDETLIFSDIKREVDKELLNSVNDRNVGYKIIGENEKRYLDIMCVVKAVDTSFYLESISDISYVYEGRGKLFEAYKIIVIILLISIGFIVLGVSYWLTKSITSLSVTTQIFAKGDYNVRAKIKSNDEIGILSNNFNLMADALSEKIEELSNEARKQEDFTASFAHELKTPLTSIIGYSDMLRSMNLSKDEIFETSNYIYSQGKRLEALSFKLLELILLKNQSFKFISLDIEGIIEETLVILRGILDKKEINVEISLEKGEIKGDKDLLISLFVNIIDNARKACSKGGKIIINGEKNKSEYKISITDNGCGIPKEDLGKIKEAFYMVDKSRSRKEGGAGIGMTICDEIIKLHNANWNIESKLSKGTTVSLSFKNGGMDCEKES